jgi:hypothetical protein
MKILRSLYFSGILALLFGIVGCSSVTTIQDVRAHPQRNWFNSTVYLKGTVGDRAPLLDGQLYQLQDQTGKIWVLSPETQLRTGEQVLIKGQVRYQSIPIAGKERGDVYIEQQHLEQQTHDH